MARKNTNLAVVRTSTKNQECTRSQLKRQEDQKIFALEKEGWKLSEHELQLRVKEIRGYLEQFNEMINGLHFDIIQPDPFSLRGRDNDMESGALAERLNPSIAGREKRLRDRLYELDEDVLADDYVGPLKWTLADTSFAIGVLAGAIFTGASAREIDKLERGLLHATLSRPNEIKD